MNLSHSHRRLVFAFILLGAMMGPFPATASPPNEVVTWVSDHAIALTSTKPGAPYDDLECLRELIGDARIVALGEQTHGTHEFQTMKHRIIRFLVEEMGFTILGLEAGWGGCLLSDEYVVEGKGSRNEAMSSAGFWFFQTTAFRNLVTWMRTHNVTAPDRPVHLGGIDYQAPHHGLEWADQVLSTAQISVDFTARRGLWDLSSLYPSIWGEPEKRRAYIQKASAFVDEVLRVLPEAEPHLTPLQTVTLQRLPRALEQFEGRFAFAGEEQNESGFYAGLYTYRDGCMAENATWWLDTLGKDSRIVLWGHNGHVAASWREVGWVPLGEHLRKEYGTGLVTVGFSTSRGTFSAVNPEIKAFDDLTVPEPLSNSYEAVFSETGIDHFVLDLRSLPAGSSIEAWMNTSRPFKVMGNSPEVENGLVTNAFGLNSTLPAMFDLIIHIEETQAIEFAK